MTLVKTAGRTASLQLPWTELRFTVMVGHGVVELSRQSILICLTCASISALVYPPVSSPATPPPPALRCFVHKLLTLVSIKNEGDSTVMRSSNSSISSSSSCSSLATQSHGLRFSLGHGLDSGANCAFFSTEVAVFKPPTAGKFVELCVA